MYSVITFLLIVSLVKGLFQVGKHLSPSVFEIHMSLDGDHRVRRQNNVAIYFSPFEF